ncbi:MAG: PKD domain-containing protein [Methanomicrobiales archaeon]|nr:PKD domain-containing protein [Methanomicrobiales archaeon]MDI6876066.1 PKD domain-containing protein [Methanomicrobiales archaeon]
MRGPSDRWWTSLSLQTNNPNSSCGQERPFRPCFIQGFRTILGASPITAPLTVRFTDTSTGNPISWAWDFGDGNASPDQHPGHTCGSNGPYTTMLTVSGSGGGMDTASRTIEVMAPST